jgi:predicted dehydrogenase
MSARRIREQDDDRELEDRSMSAATIGVGLLGAGPAVQAIHLPVLARLSDRFRVVHVMDVSEDVAEAVAARVGAAWSTKLEDLLMDPAVEVVAICSPSAFHAVQVIAAMRAGKRAILCEKPFATTRAEAEEIAAVSAETRVPVIVGAMHTFDPAWMQVRRVWGDLPDTAHTIRSSIVLPPNHRYEDWATEVVHRPQPSESGPVTSETLGALMSNGVLGLAIHDIPLIRTFLGPEPVNVTSATALRPNGYCITVANGDRIVELIGTFHLEWKPRWELDVTADGQALHLEFTPSYVQAGSGVARLHQADGSTRIFGPAEHNGYEGEWLAMYALLGGDESLSPDLQNLIDDLDLAITIAHQAAQLVMAGHAGSTDGEDE